MSRNSLIFGTKPRRGSHLSTLEDNHLEIPSNLPIPGQANHQRNFSMPHRLHHNNTNPNTLESARSNAPSLKSTEKTERRFSNFLVIPPIKFGNDSCETEKNEPSLFFTDAINKVTFYEFSLDI